ncbi:hypothetical protein [Geopsychrobacter electrodiphilus]|uniref:hypothetical protein n=1 Tax=Geopsychrobacter electrodiphilus TaxID=225196 RepID=UPI00146F6940|nr:hypothetical protein [Geopsychrobacter electrodiphilus]
MRNTLLILIALFFSMGVLAPGAMAFSKDSLVWQKCTGCHAPKANKISRVEELRTTPEEWAVIVDRMARLHGMDLKPGEMNPLIKELCSTQGLTAAEAAQVNYLDLYNNPQNIEKPLATDPEKLFVTCVRCHSAGKIHSYRMTESAWKKVRDFHLYTTPTVLSQMREMKWIPEADAVLAQLAKSQPYGAALKPSKNSLPASWLILGYEPIKGNYRGQASLKKTANGDYAVVGNLQYADNTTESFSGDASLYGGSAFRTNLERNGFKTTGAFAFADGMLRGQHNFPAPNFRNSTSSWYPQNGKSRVLKLSPGYLVDGETTTLVLEGVNLPQVKTADVTTTNDAITIISLKQLGTNAIEVQALYRGKGAAQAKLSVKGLVAGTLNLVAQIDYIAITPELGRARVSGGPHFPSEGVQFEAIAYSKGTNADDPADDVALGPVAASFTLKELVTRPGDDDLRWLGDIGAAGTYIPSSDYGPIPERAFHAEGTGLVKVMAEYKKDKRSYSAEARLVVTEPDFIPRIK